MNNKLAGRLTRAGCTQIKFAINKDWYRTGFIFDVCPYSPYNLVNNVVKKRLSRYHCKPRCTFAEINWHIFSSPHVILLSNAVKPIDLADNSSGHSIIRTRVLNATHYGTNNTKYGLLGLVTFCTLAGTITVFLFIIYNMLVVAAFFRRPRLITPFTVQFLNFVIILSVELFFDGPLNVLLFLNHDLFYNPGFCAFYKFGAWTFPSLAWLQQVVIGMDRWSALLRPHWHRAKTVGYDVRLTLSLAMSYFSPYLPLFVVDTVAGVPDTVRCDIHHALQSYQVFRTDGDVLFPVVFCVHFVSAAVVGHPSAATYANSESKSISSLFRGEGLFTFSF